MVRSLGLPAAALLVLGIVAAHAADAIFPPGLRVGLVPPEGFQPGFNGFANPEKNALILISEFPPAAYTDFEKRIDEQMWKQGVVAESREPVALATGPAFLVIGHQLAGGVLFRRWVLIGSTPEFTAVVSVQVPDAVKEDYPDATVRATLATFAIRAKAPAEEQLGGLPFRIGDLAGFRVVRVVPGSAALLTDGPNEILEVTEQPLLLVAVAPGAPGSQTSDRDRFARGVLAETPGIKDIRLLRSEPLRIGGQVGHEIVAEAKDIKTNTEVMVAQWLRFGSNGHLRVLGMARKDAWPEVFARLRAVRDGIDLH
jgi:hypothetical protein